MLLISIFIRLVQVIAEWGYLEAKCFSFILTILVSTVSHINNQIHQAF